MGEESMCKKPSLLIFAGPNGSGKSTVTKLFNIIGDYTNADDIVKSTNMSNINAAQFVEGLRYECVDLGKDFTFETVLSSDRYVNLIKTAHDRGFFVKVVFVLTADSIINVARVKSRVIKGGHDVPTDKIKSRYDKSLLNISKILPYCDVLHIYDNTDTAVRIFRKHKDEPIKIISNKYWSRNDIDRLINGTYDFEHKHDYMSEHIVVDDFNNIEI